MILTIASYKGGVGKTTTAIHLAAYFQTLAPTVLIDGDIIRAALRWRDRSQGQGFPFAVVDVLQTARVAQQYTQGHIIIDTEANPAAVDFRDVAQSCDFLVIPAVPETTATDGLLYTLNTLKGLTTARYAVLLTKVRTPRTDAIELRAMLEEVKVPVLEAEIPQLVAFDKASATGVLVEAVRDPRAQRGWKAYQAAGKEIAHG